MSDQMSQIDIGRAVKAPFADKEWVTKSLLAIVWTFLIVTIPALLGAEIEYLKRTASGREDLPDWSGFGDKWVKGFLAAVAGFIYFLPVVIIAIVVFVPAAISFATGGESDAAAAALAGGTLIFGLLAFVYVIAVTLFFYAALANYAMTDRFGAFFEFGEISKRLKTNGYFTAWLYTWLVSLVSSAITGALTATWVGGILTPAVSYLSMMMTAHLFGQWAAKAYAMVPAGAAVAPVAPAYPPAPGYAPPPAPTYAPPQAPPPPPPAAAPVAAPPVAPVIVPPAAPPAPPAAPVVEPPIAAPAPAPPAAPVVEPPIAAPAPDAPPAPGWPEPAAPPAPEAPPAVEATTPEPAAATPEAAWPETPAPETPPATETPAAETPPAPAPEEPESDS